MDYGFLINQIFIGLSPENQAKYLNMKQSYPEKDWTTFIVLMCVGVLTLWFFIGLIFIIVALFYIPKDYDKSAIDSSNYILILQIKEGKI